MAKKRSGSAPKSAKSGAKSAPKSARSTTRDDSLRILIVEARFYVGIADELLDGAKKTLDEAGATYDVITVPGALEIPAAIAMAVSAAERRKQAL